MKDGAQEPLELKLAKLPRELAPPDNLWPAIVREIARPPRRVRPLAFASAAAAASACLATALTWAVLNGRGAQTAIAPVAATRTVSFDEPRDARYLAARTARVLRLDAESGDVSGAYRRMGSPIYPTPAQLQQLLKASTLPAPQEVPIVDGRLSITLPPYGLATVEVAPGEL